MPVVGEILAFPEILLNNFGEWKGLVVFIGDGGGCGGVGVGVGGRERCGSEIGGRLGEIEEGVERRKRERVWWF